MTRIIKLASAVALVISAYYLESCSAGKSAYEHGDYYNAVITSTNRLRRSPENKKSQESLRQSYPLAVKYYDDRANAALASNERFKWSSVVQAYTYINSMYDEINRSPGALVVVPHPVNYYSKLEEAKRNAARENYDAGVQAMAMGTREDARKAYEYFKTANDFVPGFEDVNNMMEAALWAATIKVEMQPIPVPSSNVAVSAEFFDNKMSEYLHAAAINPYVRFFTAKEAQTIQLDPDHVIQLQFDEFTIGQTHLEEKEVQLQKDSVVMASYVTPASAGPNPTKAGGIQNQGAATQSFEPAVTETSQPATTQPTGAGTQTGTTQQSQTTQQSSTQQSATQQAATQQAATQQAQESQNTNDNVSTQSTQGNNGGTQSQQANTDTQANPSKAGSQTQQPSGNNQVSQGNAGQGQNENQPGEANPADKTQQNQGNAAGNERVTICHRPPGNPANTQTLTVPRSALQAHLNHGDVLGSCDDVKQKTEKNSAQGADKEKTANDNAGKGKDTEGQEKVKDENKQKEEKAEQASPAGGNSNADKKLATDEKAESVEKQGVKEKGEKVEKSEVKEKDEKVEKSEKTEAKEKDESVEKSEKTDQKGQKESEDKEGQNQKDGNKGKGKEQTRVGMAEYVAATGSGVEVWQKYFANLQPIDTNKVYGTVKATFHQFRKTVVSRGVIDFRIIDAKTKALLSVEKMPGEFLWVSEWGYFNGDERALSATQLEITKHREQMPPPAQDLFVGFTAPLFDQITQKIQEFYKGY